MNKKYYAIFSFILLSSCAESKADKNDEVRADESSLNDSVSSQNNEPSNEGNLQSCLADWKAVAVKGCMAMAAANMSDDPEFSSEYASALAEITERCPPLPQIDAVTEQASREAIASINSAGAEGIAFPSLSEKCESSVTYRGNGAGYDRTIWDPRGLEFEELEERRRTAASAERAAKADKRAKEKEAREARPKLWDSVISGKLGSWVCKSIDDSSLKTIILDAEEEVQPVHIDFDGGKYRGRLVGTGPIGLVQFQNGGRNLEITIKYLTSDTTPESKSFSIVAQSPEGSSTVMLCEIVNE